MLIYKLICSFDLEDNKTDSDTVYVFFIDPRIPVLTISVYT